MDQWTDRLSEYLDQELGEAERLALEAHLAVCESCRALLGELRAVRAQARSFEDRPPATDLWPVIAARIGVSSESGGPASSPKEHAWLEQRFSFSVPQLAAAASAALALGAAAVWLSFLEVGQPAGPAGVAAAPNATTAAEPASSAAVSFASYQAAVTDLERVFEQRRGELDPGTVRIVEQNLELIDRAIAEAQRALASDPASVYLNGRLTSNMNQKLELLRRAASIPRVMS